MYWELNSLYNSLEEYINKIFKPYGKQYIKNMCDKNAHEFIKLYNIDVEEEIIDILRNLDVTFSFIPVKNSTIGYQIYQDYLKRNGSVKYIKNLDLRGHKVSGFRVTSIEG